MPRLKWFLIGAVSLLPFGACTSLIVVLRAQLRQLQYKIEKLLADAGTAAAKLHVGMPGSCLVSPVVLPAAS